MGKRKDSSNKNSWPAFLDDLAATNVAIILESPSGARVVLIAEREYLRLAGAVTPAARKVDKLSGREAEILTLVGNGHSGVQIADMLVLAPNTVAQHLVSVRRKFGVTTTAAAVEAARRSRLI